MYIEKVLIENIKGIERLELNFERPAGWHVLIGDNASGKTTIMRAISILLVGESASRTLRIPSSNWLRNNTTKGRIEIETDIRLDVEREDELWKERDKKDWEKNRRNDLMKNYNYSFDISIIESTSRTGISFNPIKVKYNYPNHQLGEYESNILMFFTSGYGSFRRLTGEEFDEKKDDNIDYKIAAHISIFDEIYGLIDIVDWLKELRFKQLEEEKKNIQSKAGKILDYITKFINKSELLPHGIILKEVNSSKILFTNKNQDLIEIHELSDGYRTIISTVLDIIHKMLFTFSPDELFTKISSKDVFINGYGTVLIDEIDAHLHPTWQTKIGEWFTKYFPKVQFIVTTHSPIICRAADNGSIWKLENDNEENEAIEITGVEKNRLVYGNILEAMGTEAFGSVASSKISENLRNEMSKLFMKSIRGQASNQEEVRLRKLQSIFPTQSPVE